MVDVASGRLCLGVSHQLLELERINAFLALERAEGMAQRVG